MVFFFRTKRLLLNFDLHTLFYLVHIKIFVIIYMGYFSELIPYVYCTISSDKKVIMYTYIKKCRHFMEHG